jgi:hypothetical protein
MFKLESPQSKSKFMGKHNLKKLINGNEGKIKYKVRLALLNTTHKWRELLADKWIISPLFSVAN